MDALRIARDLSDAVGDLRFDPPVAFVYNPLDYARGAHEAYLRRYFVGPAEVLLIGMNPGPWGMAQTGVPFGDVGFVRDWLGIEDGVAPPAAQHPRRPILGFACRRREVSGSRLWGWAQDRFGDAPRFFARFRVWNYCPLAFLEEGGRNRTPDRLPPGERGALFAACDDALRAVVDVTAPTWAVGIGGFAHARLRDVLDASGPRVGRVLHPSPASPAANRGWAERMDADLRALGIEVPGTRNG